MNDAFARVVGGLPPRDYRPDYTWRPGTRHDPASVCYATAS